MIGGIKKFLSEVTVELKKVAWPTKDELVGSTIVIIIGVAIMAVYIGVCDFMFSTIIHLFIR